MNENSIIFSQGDTAIPNSKGSPLSNKLIRCFKRYFYRPAFQENTLLLWLIKQNYNREVQALSSSIRWILLRGYLPPK